MYEMLTESILPLLVSSQPERYAQINGSMAYPQIEGMVLFYRFRRGTVVIADIAGLPDNGSGIYGFHIHEGRMCTGNGADPFADAKGHFNPYGKEHPLHAGDMPVLFGNGGQAWGAFFTERFMPGEIAGHTVIVHDMPDDFRSQPAGDSGMKIACGVIY
ncbi:MAG: superoxide dismutase family protein [Lachnospiraceae bacterium]